MSESNLPPPALPDGGAEGGKNPSSAFDEFVNNQLDMSGVEGEGADRNETSEKSDHRPSEPIDRSYVRPLNPFPYPTQKPSDESLYGSLPSAPNKPSNNESDLPPRYKGRLYGAALPPAEPIRRVIIPPLEDGRWVSGVYRVQRDLRVYQFPSRETQLITCVTEANKRIDKSLRFILNIVPGWSAVHLYGEGRIVGFVDNSEVHLTARRSTRDIWESVALIACLLLLALALIANLDQLPFFSGSDEQRITELEQTISDQELRIGQLEATIEALRDDVSGAEETQAR